MIPAVNDLLTVDLTIEDQPTETYKMHMDQLHVIGTCDQLEAMKQTVYHILGTERYQYVIYDWNYGVEFSDLFGRELPFVIPEVERRVREALLQDERILAVDSFSFDTSKKKEVVCSFVVHTIFGELSETKEVTV